MNVLKLLLFVGTDGQPHDYEGNGRYLTKLLNEAVEIEAMFSQDYEVLATGLNLFDAVLFYTDDVGKLSQTQERGLLHFIEAGGGFVGLHTAASSFRDCESYHRMLNAFLDGHSPYMDFTVSIADDSDPISAGLSTFEITDELYYLKHDPTRSHDLMRAYDGTKDETHVVAFKHTYGSGRVFYFALGHDMKALMNPNFQEVLRRGILWVGWHLEG